MSTSSSLRSNASTHLDAIRGAAAFVVFLGHGRPLFLDSQLVARSTPFVPSGLAAASSPRITVGHEAVVVFFVLSGYFVGGSVLRSIGRGTFAWRTYLLQRLTRLWIVLIPALVLGLAVDRLGLHLWGSLSGSLYSAPAGSLVAPGLAGRLGWQSLLGNALFLQYSGVQPFGTNIALWSLACEFWYYIFFPLLVFAWQAKQAVSYRILSGLLLILLLLVCGKGVAMYFPLWLAGCFVAMLPLRLPARAQRGAAGALGAIMMAIFASCLRLHIAAYVADIIIAVVFSVLLWVMLHNQRTSLNPFYTFIARSMAKMSYTLYTVHVPFLVFACALVSPVWRPQRVSLHLLRELAAVYLVTFLIAAILYELFERNTAQFRDWLRDLVGGHKPETPKNSSAPAGALSRDSSHDQMPQRIHPGTVAQ